MNTFNISPKVEPHHLIVNGEGKVRLRLMQVLSEAAIADQRMIPTAPMGTEMTSLRHKCREILEQSVPGGLTVISRHPGMANHKDELKAFSSDRTIVALAGTGDGKSVTYVASGGRLIEQDKVSLAAEDIRDKVVPGKLLHIYAENNDDRLVRWAVLNCHEYTHVELLNMLLASRVEVLVVVTDNFASRLYWQYALADIHRLFCYVVISNIGEIGGSAVFAPFRRTGAIEGSQYSAAGQMFGSRGSAEFTVDFDLDVGTLRSLRESFANKGLDFVREMPSKDYPFDAIVPSQHYTSTGAGFPAGAIAEELKFQPVRTIELREGVIRVGVAQLKHLPTQTYIDTGYRLDGAPGCSAFKEKLSSWLFHLKSLRKIDGQPLDILVFPEVFIPRSCLQMLQDFSTENNTIVIAGLDYPVRENANECMVITPSNPEPIAYRKVSRSQYDGIGKDSKAKPAPLNRISMERGKFLIRLNDQFGRSFGILICYDYSHLDVVTKINMYEREEPLDVMFVVAHNPFSDLYRACCIADSHRFYQYVVMCNVTEYGGSGVFGPVRTSGSRQVICEAGKGAETILIAELDIDKLRKARISDLDDLQQLKFQRQPGILTHPLVNASK